MNGTKADAQIRLEQDVNRVLKNPNLKFLGQPQDEVLITTDPRYKHYKTNGDRIIPKDGLVFIKYFGETGSFKYYHILISVQLVNEVLQSLQGEFGEHPRIIKTIIGYRKRNVISQKWRNLSRSGSRHVSNASENHELVADYPPFSAKS